MKQLAILVCVLVSSASAARAEDSAPPSLKCDIGPVDRQFGGTSWIVYSCDDQLSMVVVSAEGNPAAPFYFILNPKGEAYQIYGEGTGSKDASDMAGDELSHLQVNELRELLAATKSAKKSD